VALKTLGLAAMMVRAGLALPVQEGSRVGWFDPVFCDVGDDQSLARNLSTFSAHVSNLAEVLRGRAPRGLVLLDELAGGTDPEEGAALAAAVLEHLAARGAAVAVTTHYELLKTLAVRDDALRERVGGLRPRDHVPDLRGDHGHPRGVERARGGARYGIPDDVVERARGLLPEHAGSREDVLRRLQDEERARPHGAHGGRGRGARHRGAPGGARGRAQRPARPGAAAAHPRGRGASGAHSQGPRGGAQRADRRAPQEDRRGPRPSAR
jgi:DNA mismatch repair protein MutS2